MWTHSEKMAPSLRLATLAYCTVVAFALAPSHLQAQDPKPPKNAGTILIRTSETPETAYITTAKTLAMSGYGLLSSDATLRMLTTTFRESKSDVQVQFAAMVLEDSLGTYVLVTGVWRWAGGERISRGQGDVATPIQYGGSGGSPKHNAWDALFEFASAYPDGTIEYRAP